MRGWEVCFIGCCTRSCFPISGLFRIFRYLTFRTVFASLTALLITLLIGPFVIEKLREFQIGQYIREEGPRRTRRRVERRRWAGC
jgi:phospho-N-acetylmuramoyl-pentapeptide-transferase